MKGFRLWLTVVGLTIVAGIAVPYNILSQSPAPLDVFVFWCGFGVAVIALIVAGFARWRA